MNSFGAAKLRCDRGVSRLGDMHRKRTFVVEIRCVRVNHNRRVVPGSLPHLHKMVEQRALARAWRALEQYGFAAGRTPVAFLRTLPDSLNGAFYRCDFVGAAAKERAGLAVREFNEVLEGIKVGFRRGPCAGTGHHADSLFAILTRMLSGGSLCRKFASLVGQGDQFDRQAVLGEADSIKGSNSMNSDRNTDRTSRSGGGSISATPSIALLNRRLGTSPAPRMLTPSEIDLLRQCAKEASEVAGQVLASKSRSSKD